MKLFKKSLLGLVLALFVSSTVYASEQSDLDELLISDVIKGNTEAVIAHITAGANVNVKNEFGFTPLIRAAENGHSDIVRVLIDKGAASDLDSLETAFMTAAYNDYTDMMMVLIDKVDHIKGSTIETAYMLALSKCNAEIVNALKDHRKKD